jgi:hypothetical protein
MSIQGHRAWAEDEFGRAAVSDVRNLRRLVAMAAQLAERPKPTIPRVFPSQKDADAAYRLLNNDEVDVDDWLTSRHEACARRGDGETLLICPEDGSSWAFTDKQKVRGNGPIGTRKQGARGMKVMSIYALRADGTPLGVLAEEVWARPEEASPLLCGQRPLEEKESRWWTGLQQRAESAVRTACTRPPKLWFQLDREGDQISVLLRAASADSYITVRSEDNRCLAACPIPQRGKEGAKLNDALAMAERIGTTSIRVRERGQVKRLVHMEILVIDVTLLLREQWSQKRLPDVPITVVIAREILSERRQGKERLEWVLYTTYPVTSPEDALFVVRAYGLRWRIERHHFTTKSGACNLPQSQLKSFAARRKWIVINTSVSARLQHLLHRARTEPDAIALEEFAPEEIEATQLLLAGRGMSCPFAAVETAQLGQVVESIARLGGYQGKTRAGGPAGIQTFERGYQQVEAACVTIEGQRALANLQGGSVDREE